MPGTLNLNEVLVSLVLIICLSFSGNKFLYSQENDKTGSSSYYSNKFHNDAVKLITQGQKYRMPRLNSQKPLYSCTISSARSDQRSTGCRPQ